MSADFSGWPLNAVCYYCCARASLWFIFHMLMTGGKWFAVTFDSNHQTAIQSIEGPLAAIRASRKFPPSPSGNSNRIIYSCNQRNESDALKFAARFTTEHLQKMSLLQIKPCHIHAKPNIISTIRQKFIYVQCKMYCANGQPTNVPVVKSILTKIAQ